MPFATLVSQAPRLDAPRRQGVSPCRTLRVRDPPSVRAERRGRCGAAARGGTRAELAAWRAAELAVGRAAGHTVPRAADTPSGHAEPAGDGDSGRRRALQVHQAQPEPGPALHEP